MDPAGNSSSSNKRRFRLQPFYDTVAAIWHRPRLQEVQESHDAVDVGQAQPHRQSQSPTMRAWRFVLFDDEFDDAKSSC